MVNDKLTTEMIETIEVMLEARNLPILHQLNEMKKDIRLLTMTVNDIVEELYDIKGDE